MARIRSIKPEFFLNDELAALGPQAQLVFVGLWTQADRAGRLRDRPARIKAAIMPYSQDDVDSILKALHEGHFIERYKVAGEAFIQVTNFLVHQCPNVKEPASTMPAPCQHSASTPLIGREGKEGKGTVVTAEVPASCAPNETAPLPLSGLPECLSAESNGKPLSSWLWETCEDCFSPTWVMKLPNRSKLARWITAGCVHGCDGSCAGQCADFFEAAIGELADKQGILSSRLSNDPRPWAEARHGD